VALRHLGETRRKSVKNLLSDPLPPPRHSFHHR
jgi:hypothetical protein